MAYKKKSIKEILDDISHGEMYLPAIQRKYVWKDSQITKLLDSIMLGYPIGTFLFWKVKKAVINEKEYSLYEFIKDYPYKRTFSNYIIKEISNIKFPYPFYSKALKKKLKDYESNK